MSTMDAKKIDHLMLSILITRNYIQNHGAYEKYRKSIKAVAQKMMLVNIYSILRQHIIHGTFKNCKANLDTNAKLYRYVISDDFQPVSGYPELPYHIIQPERKKKK